MVRILHISDTHGTFPRLEGKFDIIVHSGDMGQNGHGGRMPQEEFFQIELMRQEQVRWRDWIKYKPFLFVPGNHDFIHYPEKYLREIGIDAIDLSNQLITHSGLRFYGVPQINYFQGAWNRELQAPQMRQIIDQIPSVDVLVSHGPPAGILDINQEGVSSGCSSMRNALDYGNLPIPNYFLCGHIHESHGVYQYRCPENGHPMLVSNCATTQRIIEI